MTKRNNKHWTPNEKEHLCNEVMKAKKKNSKVKNWDAIARKIKRSEDACKNMWQYMSKKSSQNKEVNTPMYDQENEEVNTPMYEQANEVYHMLSSKDYETFQKCKEIIAKEQEGMTRDKKMIDECHERMKERHKIIDEQVNEIQNTFKFQHVYARCAYAHENHPQVGKLCLCAFGAGIQYID